jgi:DNA-directed RNA polymerase subunit RPC12/RpoP
MGSLPFVRRITQICVDCRAEFSTIARNALRCPKCRSDRKLALSRLPRKRPALEQQFTSQK